MDLFQIVIFTFGSFSLRDWRNKRKLNIISDTITVKILQNKKYFFYKAYNDNDHSGKSLYNKQIWNTKTLQIKGLKNFKLPI